MRATFLLIGLGVLGELGWLALWPLSAALSHSREFTAAYLAQAGPAQALFGVLAGWASQLVPGLPAAPVAGLPGDPEYLVPATALAVVLLWLGGLYLVTIGLLERHAGAERHAASIVIACSLVFQLTLVLLPGLLSQDVFSYVAYGRIAATYHLNPYVWPPSAIAKDPVLGWVAEVWRTYACPYGPVWVDLQGALARVAGGLPVASQALVYRLFGMAATLLTLALVWWRAPLGPPPGDRRPAAGSRQRTVALALLAWNPLVLLEVIGGAHNDALMLALAVLGVTLLVRPGFPALGGWLASSVCLTLSVLVKYLSGLGLVWLAVAALGSAGSRRARLQRALLVTLVSAGLALVLFAPWLELPDSMEPLVNETAGVGYVNAVLDHPTLGFAEHVLVPAGLPPDEARELARVGERAAALGAFAVYLTWEARQVWFEAGAAAVARALARSTSVYLLLVSTSVQPWYFALPVALAALLGWRSQLTRVVVGYSLLAPVALYLSYYLRDLAPEAVFIVYGLAPLLVLVRRAYPETHATAHRAAVAAEPDTA